MRLLLGVLLLASISQSPARERVEIGVCSPGPLRVALIRYIAAKNPRAPAVDIVEAVLRASERFSIDPLYLTAIIEQESAYRPTATGSLGERGLMQIRQSTARILGLAWRDAYHIERNVMAGAKYVARHIDTYGSIWKAASRYNGGSRKYANEVSRRYHRLSVTLSGVSL